MVAFLSHDGFPTQAIDMERGGEYIDGVGNIDIKIHSPVYQPLMEGLRNRIAKGQVKPGQALGTEMELAESAGISRVSVRTAISRLVEEGLVERRPGRGKGVFVRRPEAVNTQIQLVVPDLTSDMYARIARGAKDHGVQRGVHVQVYDAHGSFEQDIEVVRSLPQSRCDGAIVCGLHKQQFTDAIIRLAMDGYPLVLVDQTLQDVRVPSVLSDNYDGGRQIGKQLVERGHRRIAFIGNPSHIQTERQRLDGLRDAICDAGLSFDRSYLIDIERFELGADWQSELKVATVQLMKRPKPPTAIVYPCDSVAAVGHRMLRQMNVDIPGQVSVVGFDDVSPAEWLDPPLATVAQPFEQMGTAAMELLLKRIHRADAPVTEEDYRVLPCQWVARESIGIVRPDEA